MNDNTVTLIIGLAGIISTLTVSGLGFYFTYKERSSSLRLSLFKEQLQLLTGVIKTQGKIRLLLGIVCGDFDDGNEKEYFIEELNECIKIFIEYEDIGAAILPTEIWIELKQLNEHISNVFVKYKETNAISDDDTSEFVARSLKMALLSRALLGINELSEESLKLFSSEKSIKNITDIEISHFKEMHKNANS